MIPDKDHLLPNAETPFNKALSAVEKRSEAIKAPTREIWNPWTCPEPFLKVLAHAFSVDLWNDNWPLLQRRSIIANSIEMHRAKGTLKGIIMYLRYSPGALFEYTVPPEGVFSGPSLTREEREAWLSQLPQIRTWRTKERGTKGRKTFAGTDRLNRNFHSFFENQWLLPSTAGTLLTRRARYVVNGVETEVRVRIDGLAFFLHFRGERGSKVFANSIIDRKKFFQPSTAGRLIVAIEPVTRAPWRQSAFATVRPVTMEPELVRENGTRGFRVFSNTFMRTGFFRPSTAWRLVFERYAINDGRGLQRRPACQFMGVGRYSFPRHIAYLRLSMPGKRSRFAAGEGILAPRLRFWIPHDLSRVRETRLALTASKRDSDKLLYFTRWRPQITAGELFLAGEKDFIVGLPTKDQVYGKKGQIR